VEELRLLSIALGAQLVELNADLGQRRPQRGGALLVQLELVLVVEAEHPARAVVDAAAVVLLVACAAVLDLTLAGDRARRVAELCERLGALVIEVGAELLAQPGRMRAGSDVELAHERRRTRRAPLRGMREHPEVDEPLADVLVVEVARHRPVLAVVHEQGLRKPMQHPLDRAAPGLRILLDLDQLSSKG
jgi:hypothetical protein